MVASIRKDGLMALQELFTKYVENKIFLNREALTTSFTPENIPQREKEIHEMGRILAPALKGGKPSNVFVYGRCGTGKTLVSKLVAQELKKAANGHAVNIIYTNCKLKKIADTEYRLLASFIKQFGRDVPFTGLPTDQLYHTFFDLLDEKSQTLILVIDEIDALVEKTGDEILYNLTRINQDLKHSRISIVGITNNTNFIESLDPRIRSSLGEEELIFAPYNALQLQEILRSRAQLAFGPDVLEEGVIEKCAALAAQEHGDARRALDLLRVAGELAERNGNPKVTLNHVDLAQEKVDMDRVVEVVKAQPKQSQAILYSIMSFEKKDIETSDVLNKYQEVCKNNGLKPLTQRRVSDLIAELDMLGVINSKVISRGRYGRTRIISLDVYNSVEKKLRNLLNPMFL